MTNDRNNLHELLKDAAVNPIGDLTENERQTLEDGAGSLKDAAEELADAVAELVSADLNELSEDEREELSRDIILKAEELQAQIRDWI